MPRTDPPDAHLGVISDERTGLFHGALWRNRPTPSGSVRYLLSTSVTQGFGSMREAAASANAAFPDIEPLDLAAIDDGDAALDGIRLPPEATITHLRTQRSGDPMEKGQPDVEVSLGRRVLDVKVSKAQFERMLVLGLIVHESTSGSDPNLYYHYDHYVLSGSGRDRFQDKRRRRRAA